MSQPIALEDVAWPGDALDVLVKVAAEKPTFDAYDLTEAGLREPPNKNQWGGLFLNAYREGLITPVGFHQSRRPARAGGVCRIWRAVA